MDYCYACRRHLNGAYSCPGCGTPADQLTMPAAADTAKLPVVRDEEPGRAPGGGRASRRAEGRRNAAQRARSGRQRAAVYGVGAIAVIGALTMFSIAALSGGPDGGAPGSPPASDVPPVAHSSGPAVPDDAGVVTPTTGEGGDSSPSASASAPGSRTPPAPSGTPTAGRNPASAPATATTPSAPAGQSSSPTPTHTSHPTHKPDPAKTCKQVLWWCSG
jgi:hypothetical protein